MYLPVSIIPSVAELLAAASLTDDVLRYCAPDLISEPAATIPTQNTFQTSNFVFEHVA
jgi:hypothetical protein